MKKDPFWQLIQEASPIVAVILAVLLMFANSDVDRLKDKVVSLEEEVDSASSSAYEKGIEDGRKSAIEDYGKYEDGYNDGYSAGYSVAEDELSMDAVDVLDKCQDSYGAGYNDALEDYNITW